MARPAPCRPAASTAAAFALLLLLPLAGCGGGSPGGGGTLPPVGGGGTAPASVDESLARLGVQMPNTPRVNAAGEPLPADWTPLGATCAVNPLEELLLIGGETFSGISADLYEWKDFGFGDPDQFRLLENFDDEAWGPSYILRAVAAGDFDGDGVEELFVLNLHEDAGTVHADLHDDALEGYASLARVLVGSARPRRLAAATGDFDGDGSDEAVVALLFADRAEISFVEYDGSTLVPFGPSIRIDGEKPGVSKLATFAVGQLDEDPGLEFALVYNEYFDREPSITFDIWYRDGHARYFVHDDAAHGFARLASGVVAADASGTPRTAKSSDLALADVDADGFAEVVLGGLTRLGHPDESAGTTMGYLLYALDDAEHGLAPLGARFEPYRSSNPDFSADVRWLEHAHVEAADLDGDTVPEILLSHHLFSWGGDAWEDRGGLPFDQVVFPDGRSRVHYSLEKSEIVACRLLDKTRDNLLTWSREPERGLLVWGLDGNGDVELKDTRDVRLLDALVPIDVDADSLALEYVEGSYRLVYTEPIIVAFLAAAPCGEGQDPSDCRTAFGVAQSSGVERERSLSMTAGVSVGVVADPNIPFLRLEAEEVFTVSETVEHSTARAYEVTQTVVWETGPVEDSVIFTAIPCDQYRYRIVQTGGNDDLRGREVLVSVPRRPVHLMVSRAYYDANVPPDAPRIDPATRPHTVGDPGSYFTQEEALALVAAHDGIASDPKDVGEGTGNISVTLEVGEAVTRGRSVTASWSEEVRASAGGVVTGFSVGESETDSLRLTTGRSMIYAGRVGQIDAAHVAQNAYSFGIFAYPHRPAGSERSYQVLQYWVTPAR